MANHGQSLDEPAFLYTERRKAAGVSKGGHDRRGPAVATSDAG